MLKACSRCGRIHSKKYDCGKKIFRKKKEPNEISRFRSTQLWTEKSREIRFRDHYLCQICIRKMYNPVNQFQFKDISVHHITPISEDWDQRLENKNLITLCSMHHEMAENGEIPERVLREIVVEQENKVPPG